MLFFRIRFRQDVFEGIGRFASSADKAFFQLFEGGWIDENRHAIGIDLLDVHRPHAVDVQKHVVALIAFVFHFAFQGAVAVCKSARVLHKFVAVGFFTNSSSVTK